MALARPDSRRDVEAMPKVRSIPASKLPRGAGRRARLNGEDHIGFTDRELARPAVASVVKGYGFLELPMCGGLPFWAVTRKWYPIKVARKAA